MTEVRTHYAKTVNFKLNLTGYPYIYIFFFFSVCNVIIIIVTYYYFTKSVGHIRNTIDQKGLVSNCYHKLCM